MEITPISNAIIRLQADITHSDRLPDALDKLRNAITDLVNLYQNSSPDFDHTPSSECISSDFIEEPLTLQVISLHQVPEYPLQDRKIDSLWIAVSIVRGDGASCCRKVATGKSRVLRSLFSRVLWDQKLILNTPLNKLPLDAAILFELYGTITGLWYNFSIKSQSRGIFLQNRWKFLVKLV